MTPLPVLDCNGCSACCDTQGTPPFSRTPGDTPPAELDWNLREHADRYGRGLPCLWLDVEAKRCRHYESRPEACRSAVVPGDEYCLEFRRGQG